MQTRRSERTTRSSTNGTKKAERPNRNNPTKVTKPASQTVAARKQSAKRKGLPLALQEYHKQDEVDSNASAELLKRPREIFHLITRHLEPESLICLGLTCKLALQYAGTDCWKHHLIRDRNSQNRKNVMLCLIRDEPARLTYCEFCNTLHPPLKPPQTHRPTKLTKSCMSQWAVVDYFPQVRDEDQEQGYSLLHAHILDVFDKRETDPTAINSLSGHYKTSKHPAFDYELGSSARWIGNRLVLQHRHRFRYKSRTPVKVAHVLRLPVRLCPHSSTATSAPEKGRYVRGHSANGPLLTHAIVNAFPLHRRTGAPKPSAFRKATSSEQRQMDRVDAGEESTWRCRGCMTKFQVAMEEDEGTVLGITSWHCLGADALQLKNYWGWLVRREVYNLGPEKRNSEFWFPSRSVSDFAIA